MSAAESSSFSWERARKPEQIEKRRETILAAAKRLLDESGIDSAGLSPIAREAGLSKANLYRYFESREAILLTLLIQEIEAWSTELAKKLYDVSQPGDLAEVAQLHADSLEGKARFCELFSSMASVLEHNLTVETIAGQKHILRNHYTALIAPLCHAIPQFSKAQANEFLIMQAMFQMGLWPHTHPSPEVDEVLKREEFANMRMDFHERVRWHALILLQGLEQIKAPRIRPE